MQYPCSRRLKRMIPKCSREVSVGGEVGSRSDEMPAAAVAANNDCPSSTQTHENSAKVLIEEAPPRESEREMVDWIAVLSFIPIAKCISEPTSKEWRKDEWQQTNGVGELVLEGRDVQRLRNPINEVNIGNEDGDISRRQDRQCRTCSKGSCSADGMKLQKSKAAPMHMAPTTIR